MLSAPPGEYSRKAETQKIDGGSHKRWRMLLNSKQREEPYLGLTWMWYGPERARTRFSGSIHRCCMAVVSSCREMLG